jgi:hypothetical protein
VIVVDEVRASLAISLSKVPAALVARVAPAEFGGTDVRRLLPVVIFCCATKATSLSDAPAGDFADSGVLPA